MNGTYSFGLVALSYIVAVIASYTALDLAGCVSSPNSSPRKSWTWLIAGAVSMGTGIWSMHFIGMLAFHLPVPVSYDLPISLLSMLIAMLVSAVALFTLRRPQLNARHWAAGAALMGIGISGMHYTGMYAMQMFPPIHYDPSLFAASVLIAIGASLAALQIAFRLRDAHSKLGVIAKVGSACVMGLAITGMHYTGMAAARFAPGSVCLSAGASSINHMLLASIIAGSTLTILSLTLIVSALDAHFALSNARLAASLKKITLELQEAQGDLLGAARQAGMAEIANNVLHNVGNVLNSVNVSAGVVSSKVRDSKLSSLAAAVQLITEHASNLGEFLTRDERGKVLPGYLRKLVVTLGNEQQAIADELGSLSRSIDHIKEIVATQQSYSGASSLVGAVDVKSLVEDALRMNGSLAHQRISITKDCPDLPLLLLDKHLVLQILINLIRNAKQAIEADPKASHEIKLKIAITEPSGAPRLRISVQDDGEGIAADHLKKLFTHGFTTRAKGHGFGLHSCALAAKEMKGSISALSEGPGLGATFTLDLPLTAAIDAQMSLSSRAA